MPFNLTLGRHASLVSSAWPLWCESVLNVGDNRNKIIRKNPFKVENILKGSNRSLLVNGVVLYQPVNYLEKGVK